MITIRIGNHYIDLETVIAVEKCPGGNLDVHIRRHGPRGEKKLIVMRLTPKDALVFQGEMEEHRKRTKSLSSPPAKSQR